VVPAAFAASMDERELQDPVALPGPQQTDSQQVLGAIIIERERAIEILKTRLDASHQIVGLERIKFQNSVAQIAALHTDLVSRSLIRYITVGSVISAGGPPLTQFPAAYELSRLGSNAYPAIFNKLDGECTERELVILAHTMAQIDGIEIAKIRLEIAMRPPVQDPSRPVVRDGTERTKVFAKNARRILDCLADKGFLSREIQ